MLYWEKHMCGLTNAENNGKFCSILLDNFFKHELLIFIINSTIIVRAPNLGGLARTCEIFGAGKLVLNNKKILEDKDFLSTSVTGK